METCNTDMLREIFARGLVGGLGDENQTCIEGAIALACGLPLADTPPCVAEPDRRWAIGINDAPWESPEARSRALLPIALAQVGTAGTDRSEWVGRVVEGTIRRVLPIVLRHAADEHQDAEHADALRRAADGCETIGTRGVARTAATAAFAARTAADAADAVPAAFAARTAAFAARTAAFAAEAIDAAAFAATAEIRQRMLITAVEVALDAYRAEGRGEDGPKP